MSKNKIIFLLTTLSLLLIAGLVVVFLYYKPFRASSGTQVNSATLTIDVIENGLPGLGQLNVSGDGGKSYPSQNGTFVVTLDKTVPAGSTAPLSLNAIYYQSFLGNGVYTLPVTPKTDIPTTVAVPNGANLHLLFTINGTTNLTETFYEYVHNSLVNITATGIK
jgi:hypothetical protein